MTKTPQSRSLVAALLLVPITIVALWVIYMQWVVGSSIDVRLPIRGYDPRNLLSGRYIEFSISWHEVNCPAVFKGPCPADEFKGRQRFYIPEAKAASLERMLNSGRSRFEVIYAYKKGHAPTAKSLLIDGHPAY